MSLLQNSNAISSGSYDVNNSLRFRSSASASLTRTFGTSTDVKKLTYSTWVKRGTLSSETALFAQNVTSAGYNECRISFNSSNQLNISTQNGSGNVMTLITTQVFRDPSAWYHIVIAIDTTQATAANRVLVYINGIQITSFATATYPSQNVDPFLNTSSILHANGAAFTTGSTSVPNSYFFDGYMTDINFIDGQALTPSSFGETDTTTGAWKPKAYTGTYGTNGFYLKFSDIATTSGSNAGLGKDFSGNTNYWTTNNISVTSGTTYDAMKDSPTNTSATVANYAVMNPLKTTGTGVTSSNGNLDVAIVASASLYGSTFGTIGVSSGKWYWEVTQNSFSGSFTNSLICIAQDTVTNDYIGSSANGYGYANSGLKWNSGSSSAYGATFTTNDIIGVALDMDAGTITFYKNNTSQGTAFTGLSGTFFPALSNGNTSSTKNYTTNFGQRPFAYTPPTGFVALNTYNLPDSTIKKGNSYMNTVLYTGNGSTQSITGVGFSPDFIWIKERSSTSNPQIHDSIRGAYILYTNLTNAEEADGGWDSFDADGYSMFGGNNGINESGQTYVSWNWRGSDSSAVSNTDGSITSTVSANPTAGFSIVTYTGTGANATVGHGLGVAPKMVILKNRTTGATDWPTWHSSLTVGNTVWLNATNAQQAAATTWNSTAPTSTVFSVGTATSSNGSTNNFVAYCWAEIAGFSKFGSYTGNGSTDGPFIYLGFRPKFVMVKRTDTTGNWEMHDTSRATYNADALRLWANLSSAEDATEVRLDELSNGFKLRTAAGDMNVSSATYIYAAFAESPFKNSLAR